VLKGSLWENQLAGIGLDFDKRRDDFQFELTMYTATGMDTVMDTTQATKERVEEMNEMLKIIRDAVTPEEQRLREEVEKIGRDAIMDPEDETLLFQLGKRELRKASSKIANQSKADSKPYTLEDLRNDLSADPKDVIAKNMVAFRQKMEMQEKRIIKETEAIAIRESGRVIKAMEAGPHDGILDPVTVLFHVIAHHAYFVMAGHTCSLEKNGM
jgi:hypothetical protein